MSGYVKEAEAGAKLLNLKTGNKSAINRCATTIGRGSENDLALTTDQAVSRQHALILNIRDKYFLEDLGSRNGTYLNGKAIAARMPLTSGDQIAMGMTIFMFQSPANPSPMVALSQTQDVQVMPAANKPNRAGIQTLRRVAG